MTGQSLSEAGVGKASNQLRVGKRIKINGKKYRTHPVYNIYAGNRQGEVIHISKKFPMKGNDNNCRYLKVLVRGSVDIKFKSLYVHRFIYECYNGLIPNGLVIDHINDDSKDNRLCNLQLMTPQNNSKKAAKNCDYSLGANNYVNRKRVKAINLETNEINYYDSMNAAQRSLGISHTTVSRICQGIHKTSTSKKDGCKYAFEYA